MAMDELDRLHAHLSDALLACARCASAGRISEGDLIEVAKLLTAAQAKLHPSRTNPPPTRHQVFRKP